MRSYTINTIEDCTKIIEKLKSNNYHLWQFQYQWDSPDGWYGWFFNGKQDIELRTRNKHVQKMLIGIN